MVTKLNKNVLLVQDIPSNLIQEAILILKIDDEIHGKTEEILKIEANELINQCSSKLQDEYLMKLKEQRDLDNKRKRQKINIITVLTFLLFTSIIVLISSLI